MSKKTISSRRPAIDMAKVKVVKKSKKILKAKSKLVKTKPIKSKPTKIKLVKTKLPKSKLVKTKLPKSKLAKTKPVKALKKAKSLIVKKLATKTAKKVATKKVVAKAKAPKKPLSKPKKQPKATKKPVPSIAIAQKSNTTKKRISSKVKILPKPELSPGVFSSAPQRPIAHVRKIAPANLERRSYNSEELVEFESLILDKLEKSREEYKLLKNTLNRSNDEGIESTSGGNMKVLEDGAETAEKENLSQLASRQLKYINNLEMALIRIKNGTYGICTVTGKLISKERLIAVPHTTQSIEAKMKKSN